MPDYRDLHRPFTSTERDSLVDYSANGPSGGGAHPNLAAHDALGLATQDELDNGLADKASSVHTHAESDITSLPADLTGKAASGHTHSYEASGAVSTHEAASDPHAGYQKESEKAAASGYASLDGATKVPIAQIPTGSTASTVAIGNDSRLSDSRAPSGNAGGELGGTYPNPTVNATHAGGTHLALGTTPSTQAFGDSAAGGAATTASKNDHKHAMPSERAQSSSTPAAIGTAAVGTGSTDARADHVHATGAGTPSTQAFADAAATGSGPAAAMTDHKHAMPTLGYGLSGNSAPAVGLTTGSGLATATTSIANATYTDIAGASVSLAAGTWLLIAECFGAAVNVAFLMNVAIRDGANAVVRAGSQNVPASGTASVNSWGHVGLSAIVSPGSLTTYKLSGARGNAAPTGAWTAQDGSAVGVANNASDNTDKGSGIVAVRIA